MSDSLASYGRCIAHIAAAWPAFLDKRQQRLAQQRRHGRAAEKVAENILEDLFTEVLDWSLADVNNQVGYADLTLTRFGIKELIIETKRPGALAWNRRAVEAALAQALRYAHEQKVKCVAVSDGFLLYAADVAHGGVKDRVFCALDEWSPPRELWWLSVDGIYRPRREAGGAALRLLPQEPVADGDGAPPIEDALLDPRYRLPPACFAFVGDAGDPSTWKLPYLKRDRTIDGRRLPKAIQAVLTNYRGARVGGIPEQDIPDVLVRLGRAARSAGKMPGQTGKPAAAYARLAQVLEQLGRLGDIADA